MKHKLGSLEESAQMILEGKIPLPKAGGYSAEGIWDHIVSKNKKLKKYENPDYQGYDETFASIPWDVWKKEVGWSEKDIAKVEKMLMPYEGSFSIEDAMTYKDGTSTPKQVEFSGTP